MTTLTRFFGRPSHRTGVRQANLTAPVDRIAVVLNWIGELCLGIAIVVVPFTTATFREMGIGLFIGCSLVMGLTWAVQQILKPSSSAGFSGAELVIVGAVGLVCFQLMPLSPALLSKLSPFTSEYLTLWGSSEGRAIGDSPWATISMTPSLTRSGLVLLLGYGVFFLTLVQRLRTEADVDRVIRLIAFACFLMAVIALGQLFMGNGKYLWIFEHPFRENDAASPAKGLFTNQNHFAHFLALGLGPLIWWWHHADVPSESDVPSGLKTSGFGLTRSDHSSFQKFVTAAIAIVLFAGTLSFSRGGICAIFIACVICISAFASQWKKAAKFIVPAAIFVMVGVTLFGTDDLQHKWATVMDAGSVSEMSVGRTALWTALLDAYPSFWAAGAGVGSHAEVYPMWMERDFGLRFSHAESGYFQILIEAGLVGMVLLLAALVFIARWSWSLIRSSDQTEKRRGIILAAGLLVSVLHSLVDFVWFIPGCLIVTLTLAACLCRCYQLRSQIDKPEETDRKVMWPTVLAWVLVVAAVPTSRLAAETIQRDAGSEHYWLTCRKLKIENKKERSYESLAFLDKRLELIIEKLEKCVRIDPSDCRARSDLAGMYLARFEHSQSQSNNPITTQDIKSTVQSSEFQSPKEIADWLFRAFGDGTTDLYRSLLMAKSSLRGQPLRAHPYLIVAQLGFLTGMTAEEEEAYIKQATTLRPYEAAVLFSAGLARHSKGDIDGASEQLSRAFEYDPGLRPHIINRIAPLISAEEFIHRISPGAEGLWDLFKFYQKARREEDVKHTASVYATQFDEWASNWTLADRYVWRRSAEILEFAGEHEKSLQCLTKSLKQAPNDFERRKALAVALVRNGQTKLGLNQLKWCQLRRPSDPLVSAELARIQKRQTGTVKPEQSSGR